MPGGRSRPRVICTHAAHASWLTFLRDHYPEDHHPSSRPDEVLTRRRAKVNAGVRKRCEAQAGSAEEHHWPRARRCVFFDPWKQLRFISDAARLFEPDGFHLTRPGYQALARALLPLIKAALSTGA